MAGVRHDVCVLGSCNMDLVAVTDRIPNAGETVGGRQFLQAPGGKGLNQALAAARAGARVAMAGAVGPDTFGDQLRAVLEQDGVDTEALVSVEEPTGTAHILVDRAGENRIVVVPGANGVETGLTDIDRAAIAGSRMLLLQLEVPLSRVEQAARYAGSVGTEVVLTPAPARPLPDRLLAHVDLLVANQHELALLVVGRDLLTGARELLERGVGGVLTTLGGQGCSLVDAGGVRRLAALAVEVVDSTAAGDTFVGAFAVARVAGRSIDQSLRYATAAASVAVERAGASPSIPRAPEIAARLEQVAEVRVAAP